MLGLDGYFLIFRVNLTQEFFALHIPTTDDVIKVGYKMEL